MGTAIKTPVTTLSRERGNQLDILALVDSFRLDATRRLSPASRKDLGQFFTPAGVADFMASMLNLHTPEIHLLDPGAGVGVLSAAVVKRACLLKKKPQKIFVSAFEIEPCFIDYLQATLNACKKLCISSGIAFDYEIMQDDFLRVGSEQIRNSMFSDPLPPFNYAILNPPYKKIRSDSATRKILREAGIETSNLYTGFLSLVIHLLMKKGQLVAITPRSFCNGPYFLPFRKLLINETSLQRIHLFESRDRAFAEDSILQENMVFHTVKGDRHNSAIKISVNNAPGDPHIIQRKARYHDVINPDDPECFLHIIPDELEHQLAQLAATFSSTLPELGVSVSTGRVVDFRALEYLEKLPNNNTAPLIYPFHFSNGLVAWPRENGKKSQAIRDTAETRELLVPAGIYVLVKRFTSKEETKRIVAALYDPKKIPAERVGFENHLNYIHRQGTGLPEKLARGLVLFLNSTLVDSYFRHFSGHTQVNAADLRKIKYPTLAQLEHLGSLPWDALPSQGQLDHYLEQELLTMPKKSASAAPLSAKTKIRQGLEILKTLGLPRQQQNERSALTLLALLGLKPRTPWRDASNPLCGITPMMEFFAEHYHKKYAPNTRETVRRQTVHQLLQAGIIVANPDKPSRPVNSPKAVYQINPSALKLLRKYKTARWNKALRGYLASAVTLQKQYARERKMKRIPLTLPTGEKISLSPGGQNILVKKIIKDFCVRFTPGARPVYVGDAGKKFSYFDKGLLSKLGVDIDLHGKIPDVVVYYARKKWLVLIEAVTSHGPINPKRRVELEKLFRGSKPGLVYVTAFLDKKMLMKHLNDISWETEVWIAETPTHLVHFNGERFLGPY